MKRTAAILAVVALFGYGANHVCADEGGVSFWLPGQYASLTAVSGTPGWSVAGVYYYYDASSSARDQTPHNGQIRLGLDADGGLFFLTPTYTFENEVLGGQAAVSLSGIYGRSYVSVDATLDGPNGNAISGEEDETTWGFGDLYPNFSLKWNTGVNNNMIYLTGDIPVGDYDPNRLANIGIGHAAIDGGYGYTYFNQKTGSEFSVLLGLTYNFENEDTDYQNGIDGHIDWGASKFLSEQVQIGVAGYFYRQLTGDSGSGAKLGNFESQVNGIGPQFGYFFAAGKRWQGYFNLRGYYEWDAKNRPSGWNMFVTLAFSPTEK